MKITFVVPTLNLAGGLRVVSIYAKLLAEKGHTVTVVSPGERLPTFKEKIKSALNWKGYRFDSKFNQSFFEDAKYHVKILNSFRAVESSDVPNADIIIATFWNTAEWVASFTCEKGKKVYFIQHYEVHSWLPVERVKSTFYLPFEKIVVAQWIADVLKKEHQQKSIVISNAVEQELFYASVRQKNKQVTFCMMYSQRAYKGSQWAFEVYNKMYAQYPSIKLLVFGLETYSQDVGLPPNAEYYCQPSQDKIREIYTQSDAYLFTSRIEGFGLPILEAMACRTPVIGTRCGAAPDLLNSGAGELVDIDDSDALFLAMEKIYYLSSVEWEYMSYKAYQEAISHSWVDKVSEFECTLLTISR